MQHSPFATAATGVLAAVALSTIVLSAQAPAAAQARSTAPRPLTQVKPKYTADAMRARVEGTARVICIVEPDGSVGSARIFRSLDAVTGLDEEAVKSVRQWKFVPGTKNGVPVAVEVSVDVQFAIRSDAAPTAIPASSSDPKSLLSLPKAFSTTGGDTSQPAEARTEVVKEVPGLRIHATYPSGWTVMSASSPDTVLQVRNGALLLRLQAKAAAENARPESVLAPGVLLAMEEGLRHTVGDGGQVMAVGQASVSDHLWKWSDVWISSGQMARFFPPPLTPIAQMVFDGMRMWVLGSLVASENISLDCTFVYLSTDPSGSEKVDRAAADCGGLLKHISIESR